MGMCVGEKILKGMVYKRLAIMAYGFINRVFRVDFYFGRERL